MNYLAHERVIKQAAEHLVALIINAENLSMKSDEVEFHDRFCSFFWKHYIKLGLRNKETVLYKTREIYDSLRGV